MADIQPSQIRKVTLRGDKASTFEKTGDDWKLVGEATFSTDSAKITTLLTDLQSLRAERFARYRGAELAEFGLDQPAASITAESEQGVETTLMISGSGPSPTERYAAMASQAGRVFVIKSDDASKFQKQVADFQKQG